MTVNWFYSSVSNQVFHHRFTEWEEHQRIDPTTTNNDQFGFSVSQTYDGNTLVVGAPSAYDARGLVVAFSRVNNTSPFTQFGEELEGFHKHDRLGNSVSLSLDGKRFSVGVPGRGIGLGGQFGSALVCQLEKKYNNIVLSKEIYGEDKEDFGSSITLNGNGTVLVAGSPSTGIIRSYK